MMGEAQTFSFYAARERWLCTINLRTIFTSHWYAKAKIIVSRVTCGWKFTKLVC